METTDLLETYPKVIQDVQQDAQDDGEAMREGILPTQMITQLIRKGVVKAEKKILPAQRQPASLDLRLGAVAWRVRASFLPGKQARVQDKGQELTLHVIDLTAGAVLETGCVYIIPLQERLQLPENLSATANPKSSTGRVDVFTRLITDYGIFFDQIPRGYHGPLYAEVSPRTFPIIVREGTCLSQLRFQRGTKILSDEALSSLQAQTPLLGKGQGRIDKGLHFSVDLAPENTDLSAATVIGYRARRHTGAVDMDKVASCPIAEFWEEIFFSSRRSLILDPNAFYILMSRESVRVPPDFAAEMVPFDPLVGEFRVHYAGFFDPGFGCAEGEGSRAVLEVRSYEVPFILEHGQSVGRLLYTPLCAPPTTLYGASSGAHYQAQRLKLSKHFY